LADALADVRPEIPMDISLTQEVVDQWCRDCDKFFKVVRGGIHRNGGGFGLYLIGLHGHSSAGLLGHLAIAVMDPDKSDDIPQAVAMIVRVMPDLRNYGFSLAEWKSSPWNTESWLGRMMEPAEVRSSPLRSEFFELAERVTDLPDVELYFRDSRPSVGKPSIWTAFSRLFNRHREP
jgi:hypothetical protein